MAKALIDVKSVSKTFAGREGPVTAVKEVSFAVKAGELVGLIGPNGAGKSTTLRLLAGYLQPDDGTAMLNGHDVQEARLEAQQSLGYLAELPVQYEDLTPYEYLEFLAQAHGVPDCAKAIRTVSKLTRCDTYLRRSMGGLSKGMKQRVHLAGALVHNPPVLVLDEPTDGLDPNQKHELRLTLKELAKTKAVLVSTHILEEAEAICSRVIIIDKGKVVADTTPKQLAAKAKGNIQVAFRLLTTGAKQKKAA